VEDLSNPDKIFERHTIRPIVHWEKEDDRHINVKELDVAISTVEAFLPEIKAYMAEHRVNANE
jgi:hypothetical protein